jgi:hypothetical protein
MAGFVEDLIKAIIMLVFDLGTLFTMAVAIVIVLFYLVMLDLDNKRIQQKVKLEVGQKGK